MVVRGCYVWIGTVYLSLLLHVGAKIYCITFSFQVEGNIVYCGTGGNGSSL